MSKRRPLDKYLKIVRPAEQPGWAYWCSNGNGWQHPCLVRDALCKDGRRRTVYLNIDADTAFTWGGRCKIKGEWHSGFVMAGQDEHGLPNEDTAFYANTYRTFRGWMLEENGKLESPKGDYAEWPVYYMHTKLVGFDRPERIPPAVQKWVADLMRRGIVRSLKRSDLNLEERGMYCQIVETDPPHEAIFYVQDMTNGDHWYACSEHWENDK